MPAIDQNAVKISGSPRNPVTITNTGAADIYTHKAASVSISNHVGVIKATGTLTVTDDVWLATDGTAGTYSTSTGSTGLGSELGYAEITSLWGPTAFTANQIIAIPGLSIAVVVAAKPVIVEAFLPELASTLAADASVQIWEDGSIVQAATGSIDNANKGIIGWTKVRRPAVAGAHTYEVRVKSTVAANLTIQAGSVFPAFIRASEA